MPDVRLFFKPGSTLVMLALLAAVLTSCAHSAQRPQSGVYSGYYTYGFETSRFTPAGTKEEWWLSGSASCAEMVADSDPTASPRILYVEVRGSLSAQGEYGHLGRYTRQLTAREFLACRKLLPNERPEL